jgi:iron complex outermembrane receptor protein
MAQLRERVIARSALRVSSSGAHNEGLPPIAPVSAFKESSMIARVIAAGILLALASTASAQAPQPSTPQDQSQAPQTQDQQNPQRYEEQVVVSASRSQQQLINAPAAVTVVDAQTIASSPATNIGDLLRAVPGMNVTQVSARDVNLTTRGATSTLATSQLALVDGRSIYLDFFGMVMWDLVPTNMDEVQRIEVVRGPASAVWGANAMAGVVNVITKTPRQLAAGGGRSFTVGVGGFDRNVPGRDQTAGALFYVNGAEAHAVNDRWAYKVSAGFAAQDPLPRPTGTLPSGTPYPPFQNTGTSQPKFDARVDYDLRSGGSVILDGGIAGTKGIVHSGIGPFDIDSGSHLGYAQARYEKGNRRVAFFTNLLDGDASNLLTVGPDGQPIQLAFDTKTFDVSAEDAHAAGSHHFLSYGGNFRHNAFDVSLAPGENNRNEGGAYLQDEIFLGNRFRWVVGGRVDKFSSIDNAVFSPRTTFIYKPAADHAIRVSFNRAFRAPSLVDNHIDVTVVTPVVLPGLGPFAFPTRATGNPDLKQESLTAYEIGYTGVVRKRATVTAAVYWNNTQDAIYFTPVAAYSPLSPPPGWPLPPAFVPPGLLTSRYTYLNIGTVKDKGIELGIDGAVTRYVHAFTNYSYEWMPRLDDVPAGFSVNDINWPAKNRFNAGFDFSYGRWLGNLSANYTDSAYWQDVLDARYAGKTDPYTLLDGAFGVRWMHDRLVTSIKATNIANQDVMEHIFGDVLKRQIVGEVRVQF